MNWLRGYLGSIFLAILMAVLTWSWLVSESTTTRQLEFVFQPREPAGALATIEYWLGGDRLTGGGRVRVEVTGPRNVVDGLRPGFKCEPVLPKTFFDKPFDGKPFRLERGHFQLPPAVQVKNPPTLLVRYETYVEKQVDVTVLPEDVEVFPVGLEVDAAKLRADPPKIRVEVPASLEASITQVRVRPVRATGQALAFREPGILRDDRVRKQEDFTIEVVLKKRERLQRLDLPLQIMAPPELARRLVLTAPRIVQVEVAVDIQRERDFKPEHLMVYVRVTGPREQGIYPVRAFGWEVVEPEMVPHVRVTAIMPEVSEGNREAKIEVLPEGKSP